MALISTAAASESHALPETANPLDRRIVNQCTGVKHERESDVCKRDFISDREIPCHMVVDRRSLLGDGITVTEQDNVAMLGCVRNQLIRLWLIRHIPGPPIDEDFIKARRSIGLGRKWSPARERVNSMINGAVLSIPLELFHRHNMPESSRKIWQRLLVLRSGHQ